tara:strand:- start:255 stop:1019 length:765 start_codon:yes stop_codon:yes gene_type:complete
MKKVAICISGYLRKYKLGYKNIVENLIEPNSESFSFDFFIDTWDQDDWRNESKFKRGPNFIPQDLQETVKEDIVNTFNPTEIVFEKPIKWDMTEHLPYIKEDWVTRTSKGSHVIAMNYKIFKCNQLKKQKETSEKYDLVFRYRSDFFLEEPLLLNNYLETCNDTIVTPGTFGKEVDAPNGNFGVHDWWAFSSSKNMDYYSSLFSIFGETLKKCKVIRPETLLYYHLKYNDKIKHVGINSRSFLDSDSGGKKYSR